MTAPLCAPLCWKCGASLKDVPQPYGRRSECLDCHAELHVCRMCRHYDTGKAKQCREPVADEIKDKNRANFCEWFQPETAPGPTRETPRVANRTRLDDLFGNAEGDPPTTQQPARKRLDDLFGGK